MNRSARPLFPCESVTMLMNVLRLIACTACLASAAAMAQPAAPERAPQNVSLLTGAQQTLNLGRPLERVAIGNPEVADALLLKNGGVTNSLLLVGKKTGDTSVIVWPRGGAPLQYQVRVDGAAPIAASSSGLSMVMAKWQRVGSDAWSIALAQSERASKHYNPRPVDRNHRLGAGMPGPPRAPTQTGPREEGRRTLNSGNDRA